MPAAIHNRAEHILAKNPEMDKSKAFAIATQQMHAIGKTPKGYGTSEGKSTAKAKYPNKKGYVKTPNPGKLSSPKLASSKDDSRGRDASLGAGSLVGSNVLAGALNKEKLTGRTDIYHGTRADMVDKIKREGVQPQTRTSTRGVVDVVADPGARKASKGLAFATRDPHMAAGYAQQADMYKSVLKRPVPKKYEDALRTLQKQDPAAANTTSRALQLQNVASKQPQQEAIAARTRVGARDPGVVSMNVPLWKQKMVPNPEGAAAIKHVDRLVSEGKYPPSQGNIDKAFVKKHYIDSVAASPEGFSPKYIKGNSNFQKLTGREVAQYARARPGRFGGQLALGAGALGLGALGVKKLIDAAKGGEVKKAYAVSAYSGPLSYGSFKQESQIPPFRNPRVKTGGPEGQVGKVEKKASVDLLDEKLAELRKTAGIRDAVRGAVSKARGAADVAARGASREGGEEFARGALKAVGDVGGDALKKHKGKVISGVAGLGVAKGAYDAHRDKRVARNITSELRKHAYDPSPLGNVDMPGMSKMQTPAKQLQQSKTVAKIPATKPDAGKAFSTKLPTIGSPV